jgi:hypothetical protein
MSMAIFDGASRGPQPIPEDVLLHELSELISLREKVEQAELAANSYGESSVRRKRPRAVPPSV